MSSKATILIIIAVVLIIIGAFVIYRPASPATEQLTDQGKTAEAELPQATGNINDAINAILDEAFGEEAFVTDEDIEASLVDAEDKEIDAFGQSSSEYEKGF